MNNASAILKSANAEPVEYRPVVIIYETERCAQCEAQLIGGQCPLCPPKEQANGRS